MGGDGSFQRILKENRLHYSRFVTSGATLYKFTANYTEQVIVTNLRTDPVVVKRLFNADLKYELEKSSANCMFFMLSVVQEGQ